MEYKCYLTYAYSIDLCKKTFYIVCMSSFQPFADLGYPLRLPLVITKASAIRVHWIWNLHTHHTIWYSSNWNKATPRNRLILSYWITALTEKPILEMNAQAGFRSRNCKPIRKKSKKRNTRNSWEMWMLMTTLLTVIKTEWFVERHQIPEKSQESGSGNKPLPPSLYSFRVQIYKTKILTTNWSRNISQTIFSSNCTIWRENQKHSMGPNFFHPILPWYRIF